MPLLPPRTLASSSPRRRAWPARLALSAVAALIICATAAWYFLWRSDSTSGLARDALRQLQNVDPALALAKLQDWERHASLTAPRRAALVEHFVKQGSQRDWRAESVLRFLAGAAFDNQKAWESWLSSARQVERSSTIHNGLKLELLWKAPVGLTAWFSTIVPVDGALYVASLGTNYADAGDEADGVVRVDGQTGAVELLFTPPPRAARAPRDVMGLAVAPDGLLVACLDGMVYKRDKDGKAVWEQHVGAPVVAPPLAIDFNSDGATDCIVMTRAGKVVALSGKTGFTAWVETVSQPPADADMLGCTLSLGDALSRGSTQLLVTTPIGDLAVLDLRRGRKLYHDRLPVGIVAGANLRRATTTYGSPLTVADRAARVWAYPNSGDQLARAELANLALRPRETLVAALRGAEDQRVGVGLLCACPTGPYGTGEAAVVALVQGKPPAAADSSPAVQPALLWRYPLPLTIWGAPALVDLHGGDAQPEIVVTGIAPPATGAEVNTGALAILSATGELLTWQRFPAAIEAGPVVADVAGSDQVEILVADQAGWLHCYSVSGGQRRDVYWSCPGGDSHNTGNPDEAYAFGQSARGYQGAWRPTVR